MSRILPVNSDPNGEVISSYITKMFPVLHGSDSRSVMDAVTEEIVGTRQVRLAGCPSPESYVAIRKVVMDSINAGKPIPILSVFAPKKPDSRGQIDLAELTAFWMLQNLQERVQRHYKPGVQIRVRVEDLTGSWLEGVDTPNVWTAMDSYVDQLFSLRRILDIPFVTLKRESDMFPERFRFITECKQAFDKLYAYLKATEKVPMSNWDSLPASKELFATGFKGHIMPEVRDYYYNRYRLNGIKDAQKQLACYYSSIKVRNDFGLSGALKEWGSEYIYLSFAPQVPGVESQFTMRKLYYRSVPFCVTKSNVPFWRAKGILEMNGSTKMKMIAWHDVPLIQHELVENYITVSNDHESVKVQADYITKIGE